ncbi:uncharacterized protein V2V93DRAFT_362179 [Kockiozyma suomiensis]|uniref:uncharacterized protein n=1 Tax=Kockiozyma suomiensis TaxID=1337062 RepID=UPI0033435615
MADAEGNFASSTQANLTAESILDTFSNPSLTTTSYLNSILPSYRDRTTLPQMHTEAVNILSSFDHTTAELITELEKVVTEMLSSSTRLKYEVELLAGDVEQLDASIIKELKPQVDSEVSQKSPAMQRLEMLELVRRRLVEVITTLEEAKQLDLDIRQNNGQETENKIKELLKQSKFKRANDEVEKVATVIEVWNGTQEYSTKSEYVNRLRRVVQDTVSRSESNNAAQASLLGISSGASTPAQSRSPALPATAGFEKQEYPNMRASAEFFKQEAKEGYLGLIESLKKIRQA